MTQEPDTETARDAYSRIVTAVAGDLTPHVAALQVTGPGRRGGAGCAPAPALPSPPCWVTPAR